MKKYIFFIFTFITTTNAYSEEVDNLTRAKNYLQELKTFQASFDQFVAGEPISKGVFYLKKPGKLLWAYQTPRQEKLISTGTGLFFVEELDGEVTQLPAHPILQNLLTGEKIQFEDENFSLSHIKENNTTFTLSFNILEEENPAGGVILSFKKSPIELSAITTIDPTGQKVYVRFYDTQQGHAITSNLFKVETPFDN